jgi:predicted RNA-binding Zn ribbon-like protein
MQPTEFRLFLGSLSLNFVATCGRSSAPIERIPTPQMFGQWLLSAGVVDSLALPSSEQYARALRLREAIYRVGVALLEKASPKRPDIALINASAAIGAPAPHLDARTLEAVYRSDKPIDVALAQIAIDAVTVFGSATERRRLGRCERCNALLLSSARGRARRWCSMQVCGNREKARVFRKGRHVG